MCTPVNPSFTIKKLGVRGYKSHGHVILMLYLDLSDTQVYTECQTVSITLVAAIIVSNIYGVFCKKRPISAEVKLSILNTKKSENIYTMIQYYFNCTSMRLSVASKNDGMHLYVNAK